MNKLLKIAVGAAALTALTASMAFAGANAGATGRLIWLTSGKKDTKAANHDNVGCTPLMGFTTTGLKSMKGADVQLVLNGVGGTVPDSWQYWSTADANGCAFGANVSATGFASTGAGAAADSIYNGFASVTGVATSQGGAEYYGNDPCLSPHGVATIWFSAAGAAGANKVSTKTYGLYTLSVDQNTGCAGDCSSPAGVCILVNYRLPCGQQTGGTFFQLLDAANAIDQCSVAANSSYLTWNAASNAACPGVTAVKATSWGSLKKMYH